MQNDEKNNKEEMTKALEKVNDKICECSLRINYKCSCHESSSFDIDDAEVEVKSNNKGKKRKCID